MGKWAGGILLPFLVKQFALCKDQLVTKTCIESINVEVYSGTSSQWSTIQLFLIHNISILFTLKESLSVVTEIVLSNHNVPRSLKQKSLVWCQTYASRNVVEYRVSYHSFPFGVSFGNLNKHSVSRFHLFIMFIASAVNINS